MERLFIPAKASVRVNLPKKAIEALDKTGTIGIVSTIQHLHELDSAAKKLRNAIVIGQVLGCDARNAEARKGEVDAFLYIGSGRFHPINLFFRTGKRVFTFDPFTKAFQEMEENDTTLLRRKLRAGTAALLTKKVIGILVTTKEGQERMKDARALKKMLIEKGKQPYILLSETLDPNTLENFPFIECYVNTACPRITEDELPRPVINIDDAIRVLRDAS